MEQRTENTDVFKSSSMLWKTRRYESRPNIRCYGCVQTGHIARENASCCRNMKKKAEEYRRRKEAETNKTKDDKNKRYTENIEYRPDSSNDDDTKDINYEDDSTDKNRQRKETLFR